jgi:hypothetical protein
MVDVNTAQLIFIFDSIHTCHSSPNPAGNLTALFVVIAFVMIKTPSLYILTVVVDEDSGVSVSKYNQAKATGLGKR